jgi:polar amino acid transport system substrate-binding protein
MYKFIFKFIVIFILSFSSLCASNDKVSEIAKLSAVSLFNMDKTSLELVLKLYISKYSEVKALKVINSINNEIYFSFYKENDKLIFNNEFPIFIKDLNKFEEDVFYVQDKVGKVILYYEEKSLLNLSSEEKKWLELNPSIKLAVMNYWNHDEYGNTIHSDLVKLLNKFGGVNIVPVKFDSWKEAYDKVLSGSFLHGIMNLSWTKERFEKYFYYTTSYNYTPSYLIVRDTNTNIKHLQDLNNKTIYLREKTIDFKTISDLDLDIKIITMVDEDSMYKSLSQTKDADAFIFYKIDKYKLKKYNLKVAKVIYSRYGEVSIGVNHKYLHLKNIINKIFKTIPSYELSNLKNKVYSRNKKPSLNLAQNEKNWLKNRDSVKIAIIDYWVKNDDGESIHTDLLKLLNKYSDINFIPIKYSTWKNGYNDVIKNNVVQGIMNLSWTKDRAENYFYYTRTYDYLPLYLIVRNSNKDIKSLKDLNNKTIFLQEKSVTFETIKDSFLDIEVNTVSNELVLYKKLFEEKNTEAFLTYSLDKEKLQKYNLKVVKIIYNKYGEMYLGVNHQNKELKSIINKIYKVIPKSELINLRNKIYKTSKKKNIDIFLTKEEKTWIKNNIVKVGVESWAPIVFSTNGKDIDGISGDFLKLIIQRTGLKMQFISNDWAILLNAFKNKKIDLLPATYYTKERSLFGLYSNEYFKMKDYIYVKKNNTSVKSMNDLSGKKLAIIKGYGTIAKVSKNFPNIEIIETKDLDDSIYRLLNGTVNALFDGEIAIEKKIQDELISGLKSVSQNNFKAASLHFFSKLDDLLLSSIIKKGLKSITFEEKRNIIKKWINIDKKLKFNKKEQDWLDKNIPIRYVYDSMWAPFEWKNELEKHTGILSDILNLISFKSGIDFVPTVVETWDKAVLKAKLRDVDMFSGIRKTNEKSNYMQFTSKSIYKTPYVFVTRVKDTRDYFETFNALENKKVAIVKKSSIHDILKKDKPQISLFTVESTKIAFEKLRDNSIDVFIVNAATAKYYINKLGFDDLRIVTKTKYNADIRLAIRKDWPKEVISILEKAMSSITTKELSDIYFKWTEITVKEKINWTLIAEISAFCFLIIGFVVYNNRKLTRVVSEKTLELTTLLKSFDENVIASKTDANGIIIYASKALCEINGYTQEELIGQNHRIIRHQDMPKDIFTDMWHTIKSKNIWRGEIKNRKKDGGFYWVDSIVSPDYNEKGEIIGYSAIRQDITAKKEVQMLSNSLEQKVIQRTEQLEKSQKAIIENKLFLDALLDSQEQMVITTNGKIIQSANKKFLDFFDINNIEEFKHQFKCICDKFEFEENSEYLYKRMGNV